MTDLFKPPAYGQQIAVTYRDHIGPFFTIEKPKLDQCSQLLCWNGATCRFTASEYEMIRYLMARPNWVRSRYQILNQISFMDSTAQERQVDTFVKRARKKMRFAFGTDRWLVTVYAAGYRWDSGA